MRAKPVMVPGLAAPVSHYSHAVSGAGLLFLSGLLGVDALGQLAGADAASQAARIFADMRLTLEAAGAAMEDVTKLTIYLADINDRAAVDAARRAAFGTHRPASTLVEISKFVIPGAVVEIEAIAAPQE